MASKATPWRQAGPPVFRKTPPACKNSLFPERCMFGWRFIFLVACERLDNSWPHTELAAFMPPYITHM